MSDYPDGRYDRTKPDAQPLLYGQPGGTWQDRLQREALESVTMSSRQISMIQCPLPQVQLFPPRFGYPPQAAGIVDVMNLNRETLPVQTFSGGNGSFEGSDRNTLGMDQ